MRKQPSSTSYFSYGLGKQLPKELLLVVLIAENNLWCVTLFVTEVSRHVNPPSDRLSFVIIIIIIRIREQRKKSLQILTIVFLTVSWFHLDWMVHLQKKKKK